MLDSSRDILRSAIRRGVREDDLLALIDAIVAVEVDKARPRIMQRQTIAVETNRRPGEVHPWER